MAGPIIAMTKWTVYRVTTRAQALAFHIAGYVERNDDVLVSGAIKSWNPTTSIAVTDKGERIRLEGEPGTTRDADVAWQKWCCRWRVTKPPIDASSRYLQKRKRVA